VAAEGTGLKWRSEGGGIATAEAGPLRLLVIGQSWRVTLPGIICPICFHEETLESRIRGVEAAHDDHVLMRWQRPHGGPRGQVVTRWDEGHWQCPDCDVRLTPRDAGVLVDAVLMLTYPDCDSILAEYSGLHADTVRAFRGDAEGFRRRACT